ncbi:hypothetical protein RhiTH_009746 [Rhizoctonia solani]
MNVQNAPAPPSASRATSGSQQNPQTPSASRTANAAMTPLCLVINTHPVSSPLLSILELLAVVRPALQVILAETDNFVRAIGAAAMLNILAS